MNGDTWGGCLHNYPFSNEFPIEYSEEKYYFEKALIKSTCEDPGGSDL